MEFFKEKSCWETFLKSWVTGAGRSRHCSFGSVISVLSFLFWPSQKNWYRMSGKDVSELICEVLLLWSIMVLMLLHARNVIFKVSPWYVATAACAQMLSFAAPCLLTFCLWWFWRLIESEYRCQSNWRQMCCFSPCSLPSYVVAIFKMDLLDYRGASWCHSPIKNGNGVPGPLFQQYIPTYQKGVYKRMFQVNMLNFHHIYVDLNRNGVFRQVPG